MTATPLADRYRVLGRLGAGGMAVVMLAEDERLGRKVAIKRLRSESPDDAARRFEREAKLGASLNHPNIVGVYDIVTDDEGVLIVMEYVDGHTLRLEMDSGPMSPTRVIEVLSGVAAGLDHAHEHGVVHRDVKPANVLIAERDGTVKLADLGIATAAERTHITHSGVVLGTAAYLAPERLDGNAGGPAADVYATAAVAFEMLSGRRAVTGNSAVEIARRAIEAPAPDLTEVLPDAPKAAADVLKRGLAKDPHERQITAGQFVRELSAAYAAEARPPAAAPPPRVGIPPRRRRRRWLASAALGAAAGIALAIVLLSSGSADKPGAIDAPASPATPATPATPAKKQAAAKPAPSAVPQPAAAVTSFYTRAANGDFTGAWAMGTDNLHSQFGSLATFRSTLATLQSITFPTMRVTSQTGSAATVAFSSVAQHPDRTDHCTGQASLVKQGASWFVDHIDVGC
jgi:serine/threonine-protein kinase